MQRAVVPSAGTNPRKFKGWRSLENSTRGEWQHKGPLIDLRHVGDTEYRSTFSRPAKAFKDGYKWRLA